MTVKLLKKHGVEIFTENDIEIILEKQEKNRQYENKMIDEK